jgi:hypothetical protein
MYNYVPIRSKSFKTYYYLTLRDGRWCKKYTRGSFLVLIYTLPRCQAPHPHLFLKATLLSLHLNRREPTTLCLCVISCDAVDVLDWCTLCSAPVLTQCFGKWRNLYDIVFLHILLTHYRSSSACVMAKWLRTENLLKVF